LFRQQTPALQHHPWTSDPIATLQAMVDARAEVEGERVLLSTADWYIS
jgi:hypothetical protein